MNRKLLLAALEAVRPGLVDKELMAQTAAFVFNGGRVYTYNDQIAVNHSVPLDIEASVKSDEIYNLLKRMPDEEIMIELTESELLIKGKKNKAGIAIQGKYELPLGEISGKKKWLALPVGFTHAVEFVLFSAGGNIAQPELTCVNFTSDALETCDNFRMTSHDLASKCAMSAPVLIPAKTCAELLKFLPTHYAVGENWVHFKNKADAEFSCRTVASTFPNIAQYINRETKYTIEFPEDTTSALERAIVFLSDGDNHVHVDVSGSSLMIKARNAGGWFEEKMRTKYEGDPVEFMINPSFLKDMLPHLRKVSIDEDRSILKFEGDKFVHVCAATVPTAGKK